MGNGSSVPMAKTTMPEDILKDCRMADNGEFYSHDDFQAYYAATGDAEIRWALAPQYFEKKKCLSSINAFQGPQWYYERYGHAWSKDGKPGWDAAQIEKKLADNGEWYTLVEFQQYYSSDWLRRWKVAPSEGEKRLDAAGAPHDAKFFFDQHAASGDVERAALTTAAANQAAQAAAKSTEADAFDASAAASVGQLTQAQADYEANKQAVEASRAAIAELEAQLAAAKTQLAAATNNMSVAQANMATAQGQIDGFKAQADQARAEAVAFGTAAATSQAQADAFQPQQWNLHNKYGWDEATKVQEQVVVLSQQIHYGDVRCADNGKYYTVADFQAWYPSDYAERFANAPKECERRFGPDGQLHDPVYFFNSASSWTKNSKEGWDTATPAFAIATPVAVPNSDRRLADNGKWYTRAEFQEYYPNDFLDRYQAAPKEGQLRFCRKTNSAHNAEYFFNKHHAETGQMWTKYDKSGWTEAEEPMMYTWLNMVIA